MAIELRTVCPNEYCGEMDVYLLAKALGKRKGEINRSDISEVDGADAAPNKLPLDLEVECSDCGLYHIVSQREDVDEATVKPRPDRSRQPDW